MERENCIFCKSLRCNYALLAHASLQLEGGGGVGGGGYTTPSKEGRVEEFVGGVA